VIAFLLTRARLRSSAQLEESIELPYRWFELELCTTLSGIPLTTSFMTPRPMSLVFVSATYPTEICKRHGQHQTKIEPSFYAVLVQSGFR
jgi:hypothetical protein